MSKTEKNKFVSKIDEMYFVIIHDKTPINKIMCDTLITQLSSPECAHFFNDPQNIRSFEINNIKNKLEQCSRTQMPNTYEHNVFVIMVNKICGTDVYNKNVLNEINSSFESFLRFSLIDPRLVGRIESKDEKTYIKLLNFANGKDITKIFKHIPNKLKTIGLCKHAIHLDYNCIKYISHLSDDEMSNMCDMAIAMGHTNLIDINQTYQTEAICRKYVDIDKNNIKCIKFNSEISDDFFLEIVKKDITNVTLIKDPLCFGPSLAAYVVNKNGLLIRHIPPKNQTTRIYELATKQNPLAQYCVTYSCFPNVNINEIQTGCEKSFLNIKKVLSSYMSTLNNVSATAVNTFIEKCMLLTKTNLNIETGILIQYSEKLQQDGKLNNFYVVTGENYLNYQYRNYYDFSCNPNIDVFDLKTVCNSKINNKLSLQFTEIASLITDSHKNTFVMFFEFY